jgi:DNA-binding NtrC family response regulator
LGAGARAPSRLREHHEGVSMTSPLAVVVETAPGRERVGSALAAMGCHHSFATLADAEIEVARRRPDLVIVGATADAALELECLRGLHVKFPHPKYMFLAAVSNEELAIAAFHAGAQRYLKEPWTAPMLQAAVMALLPAHATEAIVGDGLLGGERLVGCGHAIKQLRKQLARIATAGSNVLIVGETGTGKELVAELIHLNGTRASKPFICVNTAAIPDALLENELFGHERGAFTGATTMQSGKLAAAQGGTVFLDEIADVSLAIQAKLLRAIESKSIYRLGSTRSVQLDLRIVAATNGDLERAVAEGRFRKDLYYRLNVVRVESPPLRDRVEDIPVLIGHYLLRLNRELGRSVRGLSPRAMQTLCAYHWPGNVRELRNVIEALLVNLAPETTGVVDVPPEVMRRLALAVGAPTSERERLLSALATTNWNKTKAASQLHMSRMTLYRKMHQHSVSPRR